MQRIFLIKNRCGFIISEMSHQVNKSGKKSSIIRKEILYVDFYLPLHALSLCISVNKNKKFLRNFASYYPYAS